jgi:4-amino-4-deoxy-L-arabinose transferase-like glycosyltransferase
MRGILDKVDELVRTVNLLLSPRRILLLAALCGGLIILGYMVFCLDIYRDVANCYAYYAREWGRGNWLSAPISFLPPLNIFLGGCLVRLGLEAYAAIILLAGFFYVMTIFPLYDILRRFTADKTAAFGCLLYILAPKIIRSAGMGLLEATRDFFLVLALCLLFKIKDAPRKWLLALLFGGALGLLSLSRGEGIVFALLLLAFLPAVLLYRAPRNAAYFFRGPVLLSLIALGGFLLTVSPRLAENWRNTGYPVLDARSVDLLKKFPGANSLFQDRRDALWPEKVEEPFERAEAYRSYGAVEKLGKIRKDFIRGAYEVYFLFAVIGLVLLIRRRSWRYEYSVLILTILLILPVYFTVMSAYRYYLFTIPLLMVFTLAGMGWALELPGRIRLKGFASILLVFMLAAQVINGMTMIFKDPVEHRFGMWLRENRQQLPGGKTPGPWLIHAEGISEVVYWAGADKRYEFGQPMEPLSRVDGFHLLVVESQNDEILILRARKDLQKIPHPFEDEYRLFGKIAAVKN